MPAEEHRRGQAPQTTRAAGVLCWPKQHPLLATATAERSQPHREAKVAGRGVDGLGDAHLAAAQAGNLAGGRGRDGAAFAGMGARRGGIEVQAAQVCDCPAPPCRMLSPPAPAPRSALGPAASTAARARPAGCGARRGGGALTQAPCGSKSCRRPCPTAARKPLAGGSPAGGRPGGPPTPRPTSARSHPIPAAHTAPGRGTSAPAGRRPGRRPTPRPARASGWRA